MIRILLLIFYFMSLMGCISEPRIVKYTFKTEADKRCWFRCEAERLRQESDCGTYGRGILRVAACEENTIAIAKMCYKSCGATEVYENSKID